MFYTNKQSWVGQHDIQVAKPKNTVRIFYVGDSTTQGVVAEDKKMTRLVSKELNKKFNPSGKPIEVINTGTSSWSTSQYYLEIKNKILKYSPDIVVIDFDMTDVRDDSVYRKLTQFDKNDLPIAIRPSDSQNRAMYQFSPQGVVKVPLLQRKLSELINFLKQNSALYFHSEKYLLTLKRNIFIRKFFFKPPSQTTPPINNMSWLSFTWSDSARKDVDYSMFLLGKTINLLKEKNIKVVITSVPHYPQYSGIWSTKAHRIVETTAKENGVLYLNTYEALRPLIKGSGQEKYYWDNDPTHFNEEGNNIWAKAQVDFLLNLASKLF